MNITKNIFFIVLLVQNLAIYAKNPVEKAKKIFRIKRDELLEKAKNIHLPTQNNAVENWMRTYVPAYKLYMQRQEKYNDKELYTRALQDAHQQYQETGDSELVEKVRIAGYRETCWDHHPNIALLPEALIGVVANTLAFSFILIGFPFKVVGEQISKVIT